jgi:ABC-2 type transport system permease protein
MLQLALILVVGDLLFRVPMRGSVIDLYLAATAFIAASLALGLLVSTVARTQFQAMQMTIFLILPSILLSGFVFPFDGMPTFAQYLGEILPVTHFIRLTRGVMLRDAGLMELAPDFYFLVGFSVVAMTAAALRFTKRLD